jgi:hypothetical protein
VSTAIFKTVDLSTLDLTLFLAATFLAAVVAGLAGFAFGLVAAAAWLHVLTPVQTASLIIGFGLIAQGVWRCGGCATRCNGRGYGRSCWARPSASRSG